MIALIGGEIAKCEAKCELPPVARIRVITRESPPNNYDDTLVVQRVADEVIGEYDVCSVETSDTGIDVRAECLGIQIENTGEMKVTFQGSEMTDMYAAGAPSGMDLAAAIKYVNAFGVNLMLKFELVDSAASPPEAAMEADKADSTSVFSLIWQSIFGI